MKILAVAVVVCVMAVNAVREVSTAMAMPSPTTIPGAVQMGYGAR